MEKKKITVIRFISLILIMVLTISCSYASPKVNSAPVCKILSKNYQNIVKSYRSSCSFKYATLNNITDVKWNIIVKQKKLKNLLLEILSYNSTKTLTGRHQSIVDQAKRLISIQERTNRTLIHSTQHDIDNNTSLEKIIRYSKPFCPDKQIAFFSGQLFITRMNSKRNKNNNSLINIDDRIHSHLYGSKRSNNKIINSIGEWQSFDLFRYGNLNYIAKFCHVEDTDLGCDKENQLIIFHIENSSIHKDCQL